VCLPFSQERKEKREQKFKILSIFILADSEIIPYVDRH
jgi:hypothetical protein